jgi:hypothetical protein
MPREFVPCLYHEWETYDEGLQTWYRYYDVIECFALTEIATQQPCMTMTRNSHAFHVGHTHTGLARLTQPPLSPRQLQADRARLFDTFYAAMAALE